MTAGALSLVRRADATEADACAVNAIYNPYVEGSPATFETAPVSTEARLAQLTARLADPRYPVVIAFAGETAVGFASAAPFDERAAYGVSIKTSVFTAMAGASSGANSERPRGYGRALYAALFDALAEPIARGDLHRAYGLVVAPNPASVALHRAFGFEHAATLSEVGRKFGRFYDVMWFEKRLS